MSFFDDPVPAQPPKRQRKGSQASSAIPIVKFIYPPLNIKSQLCLTSRQETQYPLEQFVDELYGQERKKQNQVVQPFERESDDGNIEYKLMLVEPTESRLEHLATQMKFRVRQGKGEAYYRIGVEDKGKPIGLEKREMLQSLKTICYLAKKIGHEVIAIRVLEGFNGLVAQLLIRRPNRQGVNMEIRILLFGQSGSGKSTLLGVLKSGKEDNGMGLARMQVFSHKHEVISGSTQTVSHHLIGFNEKGKLYPQSLQSPEQWFDRISKLLSFIDVGGHKRAEKQLVSSLCSFFPQYALWVVSGKSKSSLNSEAKSADCLQLARTFNLPLIVVVTHLDLLNIEDIQATIASIKEGLRAYYADKTPCVIKDTEHAVLFSRIIANQDVVPIFLMSNTTGVGLKLLLSFLNLLSSTSQLRKNEDQLTQFAVSDRFLVKGNLILAGTVTKGSLKKGQLLHLGPNQSGQFWEVEVKSIECLRVPVRQAKCGQVCTVAIRSTHEGKESLEKESTSIRRGMVLVQSKRHPQATFEFLAQFTCYGKEETKLTSKYQPVVNTLTTRQICAVVLVGNEQSESDSCALKMQKKKSRSIDASRNINGLKAKLNISQRKQIAFTTKRIHKKSFDFSSTPQIECPPFVNEFPIEQGETKLVPIMEAPTVRRRQEAVQIRIGQEPVSLRLRFKLNPEYITVGQKVVINQLKLIGRITEIFY